MPRQRSHQLLQKSEKSVKMTSKSLENLTHTFFYQAIYIANKYGFKEDLHRCHYSMALFYQRRKNPSQAKREAEMAEKVAFQLKDKALICDDLSLKAQLFATMADFESARRCLIKAYRQKTPVAQDRQKIEADLRSGRQLFTILFKNPLKEHLTL